MPDASASTTLFVFRPGCERQATDAVLDARPGLGALKAVVEPLLDGGRLEHVSVLFEDQAADMFVDEEGHAKGLRRNEAATAIYRASWLQRHPGAAAESLPAIVGTAVVFSRRVWF